MLEILSPDSFKLINELILPEDLIVAQIHIPLRQLTDVNHGQGFRLVAFLPIPPQSLRLPMLVLPLGCLDVLSGLGVDVLLLVC